MAISRRDLLKAIVAAGVGTAAGAGAYGYLYEQHAIEVTERELRVANLPEALAGLRIGLLTDVHCSRWVTPEDVHRAVERLSAANPDLIVLGGDYVTWGDRRYVDAAADTLSSLSAPLGVFAILGNHDDDHDMPVALTRRGIAVLRDARTRLTVRNEVLELIGIRFWTRRETELRPLLRGARGTTVLLAHDPRRLSEAAALGIPLVLSGHTHGGQVVLPGVGAIAARKFPVVEGTARRRATTLFVSRGMGTVYVPVRINCPPEVAILTLQPAAGRA